MANGNRGRRTAQQIRIEEDDRTRRQEYLYLLWEGDKSSKSEFYRQFMILSIAGLGFNITTKSNEFAWPLDNAVEYSTICFFVTIILTLLLFYLRSWHFSVAAELAILDLNDEDADSTQNEILAMIVNGLTIFATLFFTAAVILAIIHIF